MATGGSVRVVSGLNGLAGDGPLLCLARAPSWLGSCRLGLLWMAWWSRGSCAGVGAVCRGRSGPPAVRGILCWGGWVCRAVLLASSAGEWPRAYMASRFVWGRRWWGRLWCWWLAAWGRRAGGWQDWGARGSWRWSGPRGRGLAGVGLAMPMGGVGLRLHPTRGFGCCGASGVGVSIVA